SVYTLPTQNLMRPKEELDGLYSLFRKYFTKNVQKLYSQGAGVKIIGDVSVLPDDVKTLLGNGEKNSPENCGFTLIFAINYGSRSELLRAVNLAVERGEKLDEKGLSALLYTDGVPDPDLIIRTGGEMRLSNFLCFQAAYSELYFTDVLFPDFDEKQFDKALEDYAKRERRYGKIK
ncbi:MAG: di-trans,poly-cis-decaprenylcistransferase, partial [Clostridia bacterium]|nr:di-trans,poly-cis-decaprenylcistransferase [Clostridia bacterium]